MEGWEGCLIQYFHVLMCFVQSSAQVCPRNINACNYRASFFLFVSFPFLEVARKGIKTIQSETTAALVWASVKGLQGWEEASKRKMPKPLLAFCCSVLFYKHLSLQLPLELFDKEAACPAAVISSSILCVPESRPGIWPLHCVSQASAMVSWVVFLGRFFSHSFWEKQPKVRCQAAGEIQSVWEALASLGAEGKADKPGVVLIAGTLQCSYKQKGCSCHSPRIEV